MMFELYKSSNVQNAAETLMIAYLYYEESVQNFSDELRIRRLLLATRLYIQPPNVNIIRNGIIVRANTYEHTAHLFMIN